MLEKILIERKAKMLYPEILKAAKELDEYSFNLAKQAEHMNKKDAESFNALYRDYQEQVTGMLKAYEILTGMRYYTCNLWDMEL